jgi:hypothetical protein
MKSRNRARLFLAFVLPALIAAGIVVSAPAPAEAAQGLSNPVSVLGHVASGRLLQSGVDPTTSLTVDSSNRLDNEISIHHSAVGITSGFSPVASAAYRGSSGGYEVFENKTQDFAAYVHAVTGGVQTIFAAQSAQAISDFTVTLGDSIVSQSEDPWGNTLATLASGEQLAIFAPWAEDAAGNALRTSYTFTASTITQHVAVNSSTKFPIVADPAWSYTVTYSTGSTTYSKAKTLLHSCFNCAFPVSGAPKAFPSPGQLLPLTVGPWNFHCNFGSESSSSGQGVNSWGFYFNAATGHVDGVGSHIYFTITSSSGGNVLSVYAYVVNSDPAGVTKTVYQLGAEAEWANFARNLTNGK